jgi:hypothetical protein
MNDNVQNDFVLNIIREKDVPLSPLSIGESRRSLACAVVEIFKKQWSAFKSRTDIGFFYISIFFHKLSNKGDKTYTHKMHKLVFSLENWSTYNIHIIENRYTEQASSLNK